MCVRWISLSRTHPNVAVWTSTVYYTEDKNRCHTPMRDTQLSAIAVPSFVYLPCTGLNVFSIQEHLHIHTHKYAPRLASVWHSQWSLSHVYYREAHFQQPPVVEYTCMAGVSIVNWSTKMAKKLFVRPHAWIERKTPKRVLLPTDYFSIAILFIQIGCQHMSARHIQVFCYRLLLDFFFNPKPERNEQCKKTNKIRLTSWE